MPSNAFVLVEFAVLDVLGFRQVVRAAFRQVVRAACGRGRAFLRQRAAAWEAAALAQGPVSKMRVKVHSHETITNSTFLGCCSFSAIHCFASVDGDESVFILFARDAAAATVVKTAEWGAQRIGQI